MKRFLVLWLLMASCLSGLAAGQLLCKNKNPMLDKLEAARATIYYVPWENHEFCPNEWSSSRTCCEPASTDAVMTAKTQRNLYDVQEMIKEIEYLPSAIHSFHMTALTSQKMSQAAKWSCQQKYETLVNHIQWHRTAFRSSQYQCVNRLNQFARASTCIICSGRSQNFFQGDKLVIQESVCRSILGDCEQAWRGVINVLAILQVYLNEIKLYYNGELPKEHFDKLEALSRSHNLAEHFKRCPKMSECDTNTVADICQHMVSVLTPSYADSIGLKLRDTRNTLAGKLLQVVENVLKNTANAVKNFIKGKLRQSQKAYVPSEVTATKHEQHQTWALSSRDHSIHQPDVDTGRVLQYSNNDGCDHAMFVNCDTDVMVGVNGASISGTYESGP